MFKTLKNQVSTIVIAAILLTLITPALPALAADAAVVNNSSSQAAGSGSAGSTTSQNTPPLAVTQPAPSPAPPTPAEVTPTPVKPPITSPAPPTPAVGTLPLQPLVTDPIITSSGTKNSSNNTTDNSSDKPNTNSAQNVNNLPGNNSGGNSNPVVNNQVTANAKAAVTNNNNEEAKTGAANVSHNEIAGSAASGAANSSATLLNLLQSVLSFDGNSLFTFNKDITGDVVGDLYIDPRILSTANTIAKKPEDDLSISSDSNAHITNNINLSATSGDANVDHNGSAGNATSGNASAMLNLINIINSMTVAHQSFIGTINIFGNLNGDILLPPELMAALAANKSSAKPAGNSTINTDQAITNNVTQMATSGQASVDHNGSAGKALTGDALTKLTVLNLTNRSIIGSDAILVIVNVMGNWVGMIMNAPAGAKTAVLGDNTPAQNGPAVGLSKLNIDSTAHITNNINLSATSGDANVDHNGSAGNATSGKASTAVNIVNMINSQISVSDWFGILFINVYGNWNGSFGINTTAGDLPGSPQAPEAPLVEFIPAVVTTTAPTTTKIVTKVISDIILPDNSDNKDTKVLSTTIDNGKPSSSSSVRVNSVMLFSALGGLASFGILGAVERRGKHKRYSMDGPDHTAKNSLIYRPLVV